jgi:hypothetical protein
MADQFITVATFHKSFEAQLAKNLLENEGIEAMMGGEFASDMLFSSLALGDQIVLQVREDEAQRAAGILAQAAAEARLDDDWEEQTEAGVWICSICGEPISNRLSMCYSCQTPKDSIRAAMPPDRDSIQTETRTRSSDEDIQKDAAPARSVVSQRPASPQSSEHEEENIELPTAIGDVLARKAFVASLFGALMPILLPISWFYLFRAVFYGGETSAKGFRHFYAALLLNGAVALLIFALCGGIV